MLQEGNHARQVLWTRRRRLAVSLVAGVSLAADEPVPALQDLMGAKGASVETSLTGRGYAFLGQGEGARSDFQYWRERRRRSASA